VRIHRQVNTNHYNRFLTFFRQVKVEVLKISFYQACNLVSVIIKKAALLGQLFINSVIIEVLDNLLLHPNICQFPSAEVHNQQVVR
jgi:hypothetical protein